MQDTTTGGGRHRRGTPGLNYVTTLVRVVRRSFLTALFVPGRHRQLTRARNAARRPATAHAV
jgi:hypothetical protein